MRQPVEGTAGSAPNAGSSSAGGSGAPAAGDAGPQAFEVPLDLSVAVGAFKLQLGAAKIEPAQRSMAPGNAVISPTATVRIEFAAHNNSTEVETPFAALDDDGIMLEVAGEFFFGIVDADPVPGLRDGAGAVSWKIEQPVSPDELRAAIVTFGEAEQNNVMIPLGNPAAAVTLVDVDTGSPFTVTNYRNTNLEFSDVHVQYNSRGQNVPLKSGTAMLVLVGTISAAPDLDQYGEAWTKENAFLERPDGVSVAPDFRAVDVRPGDRKDVTLSFELEQPVSGTYTFRVTARDLAPVTHEIVVP